MSGKGRNGGKFRQISWHPRIDEVLEEYLRIRDGVIEKARKKNPAVKIPENLLIYERGGKLFAYQKTVVDNFLKYLGERLGLVFTNHDLRRTCGRMMYRAGVTLEQIARIFGHADTRTTAHYIGLDFEDMNAAMTRYSQYQDFLVVPQMVQNEPSQSFGGQSGMTNHETIWLTPKMP